MSLSQRQVSSQSHLSHAGHNSHIRTLLVLILFEHLITIDREIDIFWKPKLSGAAALFLTNRYLILVDSALKLETRFDKFTSIEVSQADSHARNPILADIFAPP